VFPVRYGQTYRVELSFKEKTGRWIMSRSMIVILIYRRHKAIDLIHVIYLVFFLSDTLSVLLRPSISPLTP
jgi:hypothetical protein